MREAHLWTSKWKLNLTHTKKKEKKKEKVSAACIAKSRIKPFGGHLTEKPRVFLEPPKMMFSIESTKGA